MSPKPHPAPPFARMLTASADWESWLTPDGQLAWVNDAVTPITGYTPSECLQLGPYPACLVHPSDAERFARFQTLLRQTPSRPHLHLRMQRKDGVLFWVSLSWQTLCDEGGQVLGSRISIRDLTQSAALHDHASTLRKAATRLMQQTMQAQGKLTDIYACLTEGAARALAVERAGVWFFDRTGAYLTCADVFVLSRGQHEQAAPLPTADFPTYINAISTDQLVTAHDACTDPMTAELAQPYLKPMGIASMLDAPIVRHGVTVGVLCFEHMGAVRYWGMGEQAFAESLADFIALSLESASRADLQEQTQHLASIIEASPDLVSTVSASTGKTSYVNPAGRRLLGLSEGPDAPPLGHAQRFYSPQQWAHRETVSVPQAIAQGMSSEEAELITAHGETIPVWRTIIAHRDAHGEVAYLSAVIHDLREQKRTETELRQRKQALQELNDELEQRVADRTRKIEEINQNLETFAFSVSHDLKAPLRGIDGYSRLLQDDYQAHLPDEARSFIDNIRSATERMHELIDDLLAYSRVGRRELATSSFSSRQAIARVMAEREHDLRDARTELVNRIDDVTLTADLDCFIQIMRNLIDNAVKFTRDAACPSITLSSQITPGRILFSVKDNGCGFDMKYHDRIFSIFQRLHRNDDYPGTGVGLAIVSKAAERLGGKVWAVSAPGQGAEFFLELPHVA